MDQIQKMLQTIINGQRRFRQEVLNRFEQVDQRFENIENELSDVKNGLGDVQRELHNTKQELNQRMDKLGNQLAYLEDDAPTREEFDHLENRVAKLESQNQPVH